jgi:type II secretory pathway component GspD/PulD (secretin)
MKGSRQVVLAAVFLLTAMSAVTASAQVSATAVIHVRSIPAGFLVPILRPLVPQWGHLAAMVCTNDLIIVDRFASLRRMETIVKAMDTGAPITPPKCHYPMSQ